MEWFATGVHWYGNPVISKEIDFDSVLLQLADTSNTQFEYPEGSMTFITETF